jgi:hypothetical protein
MTNTSAVTGAALIDETATPTSQGYQLTRIYRTKTHPSVLCPRPSPELRAHLDNTARRTTAGMV